MGINNSKAKRANLREFRRIFVRVITNDSRFGDLGGYDKEFRRSQLQVQRIREML